MYLLTFSFPQGSVSLSFVMDGEQILYYDLLFGCRQIMFSMSPVLERGQRADLCSQLTLFHLTREAQALEKSDLVD